MSFQILKNNSMRAVIRDIVPLTRSFHLCVPSEMMKKGKGKGAAVAEEKDTGCDLFTATGINLKKTGDDPKLAPTEEYPDWLWTLGSNDLPQTELERRWRARCEGTMPEMELSQMRRLIYLRNKKTIKLNNDSKAK
mmetsp:Transcript_40041/g.48512  ORF Transcript_40041/g.48512 Transcript_40041/m.48512 type:complete len:136 (-) Transcript_40041:279-686(-)|eukprot:CAMPEP_0197848412 /NCGR_PEP_ID=MMETSP1438-20131217/8677_1 /TAXON_ID=1461541 /ORGANISM="Pterosperma sp., Strain CCMP1384" /LENGTH=135 /DNA_ID=CAMNT_0043460645 /DNA_START=358 /DNA_END=765 /DNA_ORIENTATION=+